MLFYYSILQGLNTWAFLNVEGEMLSHNATLDCGNTSVEISQPLLCDITIYSGTSVQVTSSTGDAWHIEGKLLRCLN